MGEVEEGKKGSVSLLSFPKISRNMTEGKNLGQELWAVQPLSGQEKWKIEVLSQGT